MKEVKLILIVLIKMFLFFSIVHAGFVLTPASISFGGGACSGSFCSLGWISDGPVKFGIGSEIAHFYANIDGDYMWNYWKYQERDFETQYWRILSYFPIKFFVVPYTWEMLNNNTGLVLVYTTMGSYNKLTESTMKTWKDANATMVEIGVGVTLVPDLALKITYVDAKIPGQYTEREFEYHYFPEINRKTFAIGLEYLFYME